MKRGFTLIELLAVIVILAIIAVIATPIVLNIIKDAKKSSNIRSAENYIHSLELSLVNNQLTSSNLSDGFYSIDEIEVNVDGKKPTQGYIQIEKGNVVKYNVMIDNQEVDSVKNYDVWDGNVEENDLVKSTDGCYHIKKAKELAKLASMVNSGKDFLDEKIILDVNIDLNNLEWIPIGNLSTEKYFKGIFNGNNHIIKNLYITTELIEDDITKAKGLFGVVINSKISNIIIMNSYVKSYQKIGILLGQSMNSEISNINIYNSKLNGIKLIGGVEGYSYTNDKFNNIVVINSEFNGRNIIGGIIGEAQQTSILDCKSRVRIEGETILGGIVGAIYSKDTPSTIGNIRSNSSIVATGDYVGGIAGVFDNGEITIIDAYSEGDIKGNNYIGGISGVVTANNTILKYKKLISDAILSGKSNVNDMFGDTTTASLIQIN